jgi:hypothetical protein
MVLIISRAALFKLFLFEDKIDFESLLIYCDKNASIFITLLYQL